MPSLSPLSGGSESLTPLAEGTLTATPLAAKAETLTPLTELRDYPSVFTPGLLPSITLFPGQDGPYPKDNENSAAIEGLALASLAETTAPTLTPLPED